MYPISTLLAVYGNNDSVHALSGAKHVQIELSELVISL